MTTVAETLAEAQHALSASDISDARRDAATLLAFAIKRDKTFLFAHPEYELTGDESEIFRKFIARRATREPLQYITGTQEFYGLDFLVTPDVLIPRPETEIVVESAINVLQKCDDPKFCDVGTGSGCIAVSVLANINETFAVGLDVSPAALAVAKTNAANNGVDDRLDLRISDVFLALNDEKFDAILSNPPYIPVADLASLQAEVRDFEPHKALSDGGSGLSIIERIVNGSSAFLKPGGHLILEIGFQQSDAVRNMFSDSIWALVEIKADLQGIPRCVVAKKLEL